LFEKNTDYQITNRRAERVMLNKNIKMHHTLVAIQV